MDSRKWQIILLDETNIREVRGNWRRAWFIVARSDSLRPGQHKNGEINSENVTSQCWYSIDY